MGEDALRMGPRLEQDAEKVHLLRCGALGPHAQRGATTPPVACRRAPFRIGTFLSIRSEHPRAVQHPAKLDDGAWGETHERPTSTRSGLRGAPGRLAHRRASAPGLGPGQAGRRDALGAVRDAVAGLVRPGRGGGPAHAVLGALRPARRAREADARQPDEPEPGRVVDGERRPADLRVQAARGAQVPQRRSLHRRGREVQLPSRQGLEDAAREGQGGDGRRARPRALPAARALAGLHDLLRHDGLRRGLDRAEEVRGAGGRRRLQESTRSGSGPTSS